MQTVYLVRHGETDHNVEGRWQGHLDVALNQEGLEQAKKLSDYLADTHFDVVYSSDLQRAADTARIVLGKRTQAIHFEPRLREIHLGVFQGLTREQIASKYPAELTQWDTNPAYVVADGESRLQLQERSFAAWSEITQKHADQTILMVSHGGTLRLMLQRVLQVENPHKLRFANTSVTILQQQEGGWHAHTLNSTAHLNGG
jgi:broad specificity phosphatase PhoE